MRSSQSDTWFSHSPAHQASALQGPWNSRAADQAGGVFELAADKSSPCSDFLARSDHRAQRPQHERAVTGVRTCLMHICSCVSRASSGLESQPAFASLSARIQTDLCKREASGQQAAVARSGQVDSSESNSGTPCSRKTSRKRRPHRRRSAGRFASASSAATPGEWKLPSFLQWKQWKPPRCDPQGLLLSSCCPKKHAFLLGLPSLLIITR